MSKPANREATGDLAKLQRTPAAMASSQNAQQHLRHGRYAAALPIYRDLVQRFPGVAQLWVNLGVAAAGELEFGLANQAFQRGTELAPGDSALLNFVATQFYQMRCLDQAVACLKGVVAADPASIKARLALASWFERIRRLDEAWECIEACLSQDPRNAEALYCRAYLLQCKGLNAEAETTVRDLLKNDTPLPPAVQFNAYYLLGIVLDALGQYGEALPWLEKAKALQYKIAGAAKLEKTYAVMDQRRRELLAQVTPEALRRWREEAVAAPCPHPLAFLGGAPRSGTTLLEQILGAHPQVQVFGETPSFMKELWSNLRPPPPATGLTLKSLDDLAADSRAGLFARYFKSLLCEMKESPGGKLLVDKNPSMTASLHFWLRLFPQSKIIIALRDPRDVIISSYFQNLTLVWGNVHFLSLKGTARFYSDCMDTWLRLRELGGFDWIETRYEDVVANLEGEGRRVTSFLGLPWHEAQAAYYETARGKYIFSPTYNEVTKPVHNRSVGRWKHYAEALEPLQAGLAKYCQAFGYD